MEIITYGNVDMLASILQGVAFILNGTDGNNPTDFKNMMAVVALIGFMVAMVAYAIAPQKLQGWQWLGTVVAVVAGLTVPKMDAQVVDRLQNCAGAGSCVTVVRNVPLALVVLASVTSKIGDKLTELYETTFQNVVIRGAAGQAGFSALWNNASFRGNGMMFGNKLIRSTSRVSFPDTEFRFDLIKYIENCVMPDMSDGSLDPDAVRRAIDIWAVISANPNPARYSPTHTGAVLACTNLAESLNGRMTSQVDRAKAILARSISSNAVNANGTGMATDANPDPTIDAKLQAAYERTTLGNAGLGASGLIRQNAMINAMADSNGVYSQRTDDPSSVMLGLAEAQAKVSNNSSWITSAKIAEEAMPMIRNGIEAILYAGFPIVVLMMLVTTWPTTGKLIKSYASALLWIQMWPPLYAVLNHMAVIASSNHIAAAGALPGGGTGLALLNSAAIYENTISDMAVVGYLVISIPVIAWSLVKGMDSIGSGALAGAGAFSSGAGAGAAAAASGNVNLGNTSMDQVNLSPSYRAANFSTYEDAAGSFTTDNSGRGLHSGQLRQSNVGVDASYVHNEANKVGMAAKEEASAGTRDATMAASSLQSTFNDTMQLTKSRSSTDTTTSGGTHTAGVTDANATGTTTSTGESGGHVQNTSKTDMSGASRVDSNQVTENTQAGVSGGIPIPGIGGISAGQTVGRGTTQQGARSEQTMAAESEMAHKAEQWSKSKDTKHTLADMKSYMESDSFQHALASGNQAAQRLQAGYTEASKWQHSSEAHFAQSESLSTQAESMKSNAASISVNLNNAAYAQMNAEGSVGQHASDMRYNVSAAGQRVYNATQGAVGELSNGTTFGAGGPQGNGQMQVSREFMPHVPDGEVSAMRGRSQAGAPTQDGVWEHQMNKRDAVGDAAAKRGVGLGSGGGGGGGGGAAPQREALHDKIKESQNAISDTSADIGAHQKFRQDLDEKSQAAGSTAAHSEQKLPNNRDRAEWGSQALEAINPTFPNERRDKK